MTRDLYSPDLANALKAHAGEKYRPSNGSEGDMFFSRWCAHCTKDEDENCSLILASLMCDVDDPEYPVEWCYGEDGQPKCTAFEERRDDERPNETHKTD